MARILIVDDDDDLAATILDVLQLQNHEADHAVDGASALQLLRQRSFDLLLLDWQLPDMTGLDICTAYRQSGGSARILMLTGMRSSQAIEAGKSAGADDFLTKPFNVMQLLERLATNLACMP